MDARIRLEKRAWSRELHMRHLNDGEWIPMLDADGNILQGIVGKHGVAGRKLDGTTIGSDFVKMDPGASFPLHEHTGDHQIFFISGSGFVIINDERIDVTAGHLIHIPGEYPHGVGVDTSATEPLIFVPTGHPHKRIDAHDRMQHPHRRD